MYSIDTSFFLRKRYLVTALVFLGWALLFILRLNMSISIVDMTSNKTITVGNETFVREAEFDWSSSEKSLILGSFSWGLFAAPLGALVANKIGGATTFGVGIILTAIMTIFTPLLVQQSVILYLIVRILEGVFESFSTAASLEVFVQWSPPTERSRLIAFAFLGSVVGTMLCYPICGTIAFYMDWKAVFYITGGASIVWYVFWLIFVRNSPAEDNLISKSEQKFLSEVNQRTTSEKISYPWKQILSSTAVWAFINDRFVETWSLSFLTYFLPIYINDSHYLNIQDIGFLSGIPHLCAIVGLIGGATMADFLRNRKILSATNVHRLYLTFSQITAVILLIIITLWRNSLVNIICLSLFRLLFSVCDVSYVVLPIDLGAHYAGFIVSVGMVSACIGFTVSPIVMGLLVTSHSIDEWNRFFIVLAAVNLWGGIIFFKYGSGELQPWATDDVKNKNDQKQEE